MYSNRNKTHTHTHTYTHTQTVPRYNRFWRRFFFCGWLPCHRINGKWTSTQTVWIQHKIIELWIKHKVYDTIQMRWWKTKKKRSKFPFPISPLRKKSLWTDLATYFRVSLIPTLLNSHCFIVLKMMQITQNYSMPLFDRNQRKQRKNKTRNHFIGNTRQEQYKLIVTQWQRSFA